MLGSVSPGHTASTAFLLRAVTGPCDSSRLPALFLWDPMHHLCFLFFFGSGKSHVLPV